MLKTEIRAFISNNKYQTLAKMQLHARKREIELETQKNEKRRTSAPSHLATKKFKPADSRSGGKRGPRCNKFLKSHEGVFRALLCYMCSNEG